MSVYTLAGQEALSDPFVQFSTWYQDAKTVYAREEEASAMALSTCTPTAKPSCRTVLLKDFSTKGFSFYTNYTSRKSTELEANPYAALVLHWPKLGRQVRIEGHVVRAPKEQSDKYFATRPKGSKVGAWVSHQSKEVKDREELLCEWRKLDEKFKDSEDVPRPEFWGGWTVVPYSIEFWSNGEFRLHDRVVYRREDTNVNRWSMKRLSP
eukprot:TRINITY_DN3323_c0_g1_i1.p1 TRINITY_DN3323_c0_g1~~TRINITY_DN3323_c0_g1_i1.p1  ORF type:complete len:209 (-),score=31.27 TRINITY_DN3323_c0_g1_i1:80-706(-)